MRACADRRTQTKGTVIAPEPDRNRSDSVSAPGRSLKRHGVWQRISELPARLGKKHPSAQRMAMLGGSAFLGHGVMLLASVLLTRLYTPADFGVLGVYTSLLALSAVTCLRYELAILLPKDDDTAVHLLVLSLVAAIGFCLLIGLICWLLGEEIVRLINAPALMSHLWILPVALFAAGAYQTLNYWSLRKKAFKPLALRRLTQSIGTAGTQVSLGWAAVGPMGLLLGDVAGRSAGVAILGGSMCRQLFSLLKKISLPRLGAVAYRYRIFPLVSTGSALVHVAGGHLPPILLGVFYGPEVLGMFILGQRTLGLPVTLVAEGVGQVYLAEASTLARENPRALLRMFLVISRNLFLIVGLPIALIAVSGPWVFGWVFGTAWREAGEYVRVFAPVYLVQTVLVPLVHTLNILEKQRLQLAWDVARLLLVIGCISATYYFGGSAYLAITVYATTACISFVGLFILIFVTLRIKAQSVR